MTTTTDAARQPVAETALRCGGCGGPHPFDTSVPSPLWNRVVRDGGLSDFLCTTCIVLAFVRAGESFEAELYGPPVDRDDGTVTTITVTVDGRPMAYSYGDLDAELRALRAPRAALATREPDPAPLDVGRLAEAMHVERNHRYDNSENMHPNDHALGDSLMFEAERVAAEYARLAVLRKPVQPKGQE